MRTMRQTLVALEKSIFKLIFIFIFAPFLKTAK